MRIIVTCMKNEGPFLLEWCAYHLSIGFDRFLVYSNDCDDLTDRMLDRLAQMGLCTHLENPRVGTQRPQAVAMRDMVKQPLFQNADWVMFGDCDEFLNIHLGAGHLDDLLNAMGAARAISVMWRLFGDAGISHFQDKPVVEQFLFAAPAARPVSVNAWGFKSLFIPDENIARIGAHRPFYHDLAAIAGKWRDSSGQLLNPDLITQGWRFTRNTGGGYGWAQINHYAIRSRESFLVKSDRGHVLHTHKQIDAAYYHEMNHNQEKDTSILRRCDRFHNVLADLKSDSLLSDLHARAVQHHRKKALQLREELAPLYNSIHG